MSTIEDFENAPVGATATHSVTGVRAMKIDDVEPRWIRPSGIYLNDEDMVYWNYTLDPSAPTTAREALDLAWELAHPVEEGQAVPEGTRYLTSSNSGVKEHTAQRDVKIRSEYATVVRTLEPLSDSEHRRDHQINKQGDQMDTTDNEKTIPASVEQFRQWWMDTAEDEIGQIVDKMTEYGGDGRALDLIDIGRDLLLSQGVSADRIDDAWATETGIYFYARGKISRWTSAVVRGDRVSDDTLHDLGVYVRMAQRVRAVGGWPV